MPRLYFGLTSLHGDIASYAQRYSLVEVSPDDASLPRASRLGRWRDQAGPSFAFSVVLPPVIGRLDRTGAFGEALSRSLEVIRNLEASAVVLPTPASVRPTKANRDRLARLREKLPAHGVVVGWEASGLWEPESFIETATEAGYLPIRDAALDPLAPGPIAYTRLHAIGSSNDLGMDRIATVAEQLAGRREAYCAADPPIAGRVKAGLGQALEAIGGRSQVPAIFRPDVALSDEDEEQ